MGRGSNIISLTLGGFFFLSGLSICRLHRWRSSANRQCTYLYSIQWALALRNRGEEEMGCGEERTQKTNDKKAEKRRRRRRLSARHGVYAALYARVLYVCVGIPIAYSICVLAALLAAFYYYVLRVNTSSCLTAWRCCLFLRFFSFLFVLCWLFVRFSSLYFLKFKNMESKKEVDV